MTIIDWLLDSDPSIRWQVMRDLTHEAADMIADERGRVATEGWGGRLLALQAPDGLWAGRPWSQDWTDTFHVLDLLRRFGLDRESEEARGAIGRVREHVVWRGGAPVETPWSDNRFFEGEVEPCINGNVVATGSYFGVDMTPLVNRLLSEQLPDGGWNCEAENGATVTGALIDPSWLRFSFPTWWHYDVLRGLSYMRDAAVTPDERTGEAVGIVEDNRDADGRWPLQNVHDGEAHFQMEDREGQPSRWNTLRALRALDWFSSGG